MKNEIILWFSAITIIFLLGYIKNVTDKDYPVTGTFGIEGKKVSYKLDKVSYDKAYYKNTIISDIKGIKGKLVWIENDLQKETLYKEIDRGLECEIPRLLHGKHIKYKVVLNYNEKIFEIPAEDYVTLTFWGNIPSGVSVLNFIILYGGLIMVLRCSLELFNKNKNLKKYAVISSSLFLILNLIIIPLRNSYKLGAINNYVPPIADLFEPILLAILFLWIAGTILLFYKKFSSSVTIALTLATILLFFFYR